MKECVPYVQRSVSMKTHNHLTKRVREYTGNYVRELAVCVLRLNIRELDRYSSDQFWGEAGELNN